MTSRERLQNAINFKETDRLPFDIGGTTVSSFTRTAFEKASGVMGLQPDFKDMNEFDPIQQIIQLTDTASKKLGIDTYRIGAPRLAGPETIHTCSEQGICHIRDQFNCHWTFNPERDFYYNITESPLKNYSSIADGMSHYRFPKITDAENEIRTILEKQTAGIEDQGLVADRNCAGITEVAFRLRGYEEFFIDMALDPAGATVLMEKILEYKLDYWSFFADHARKTGLDQDILVAVECDDLGTQDSLLFSPDMIKNRIMPLQRILIQHIRKELPGARVMFHSDGAISSLIPAFIDMGVNILNPVQFTAAGMDLIHLKNNFGKDLVFWGGGVDTQNTLPYGTPEEVADEVKRNIEILAPGGGFVFAAVHNIQADVPGKNFKAMWDTLKMYSKEKQGKSL